MYSTFGKLLVIDLNKSDISERKLEQEIFQDYLGGKGLGSYLLYKMLPPGVDPLSADNLLIFTTGRLPTAPWPRLHASVFLVNRPPQGFTPNPTAEGICPR